ncbi:S8 family serine peptidase [Candidatus Pacearchaeota archaeon]|nr:S8 family serine peptidase [Candidatus Pacearchaeota archaeon]
MNKRLILFLAVIFIIVIKSVWALADIEPQAIKSLEKEDKIPVIITFKDASSDQNTLKKANVKRELVIEQRGHIGRAKVNSDELEKLRNYDNIAKISYDYPVHAFLQTSPGIINATRVWPLLSNNVNITGTGQSICIIDTGINYSHSSLGGCYGNNNASSVCKVKGGYNFVSNSNDPLDDHGHGTFTAGISAAQGNITGVAPGASLLALKALDNAGSGFTSDIIAAIDWCVGNASVYNISVISMSLGTSQLYSTYCDSQQSDFADSINNAVAKNISVIAAVGNENLPSVPRNTSAIAAPACVENATSVSATNKNDNIASYAHYSPFVSIFAPGTSINSTDIDGTFSTDSGTSMAAPHVAGGVALIKQFLSIYGLNSTSRNITRTLNTTGDRVTDGSRNFTRVNLYRAILAFDIFSPSITLLNPANNTINLNTSQIFRCSATDFILQNGSVMIWNSTGALINESTYSVLNGSAAIENNVSLNNIDTYLWNCIFTDAAGNRAGASSNLTLDLTSLTTSLISPVNNLNTRQNQTFTCNSTSSSNLANSSFYIWNETALLANINSSISGNYNLSNFSYNVSEGSYEWNCKYQNIQGTSQFALSNFTFSYDLTPPTNNIQSPINGSWYNYGRFNASINEQGNCSYTLDNGINNVSMNSTNYLNFSLINNTLIQNSTYNVTYLCTDNAGNTNQSAQISFTIDLTPPSINTSSPDNSATFNGASTLNFNYTVQDNLNISKCELIVNSAVNATNSSITNTSNSYIFTQTFGAGSYTWNISCLDDASNEGISETRSFVVNSPSTAASSSGGGSGGGGGGGASLSSIYTLSPEQSLQGYTKELKKSDKIQFTIFDINASKHTVSVENITNEAVNITIRSSPINVLLGIGQSIKLNLTSADYYDLYIKVEKISLPNVLLTIQTIKDPIINAVSNASSYPGNISVMEQKNKDGENARVKINLAPYFAGMIIVAMLAGIVIHIIDVRRENKMKDEVARAIKSIKKRRRQKTNYRKSL